MKILFTAVLLALALPAAAGDIEEKVNAALAAESRPASTPTINVPISVQITCALRSKPIWV